MNNILISRVLAFPGCVVCLMLGGCGINDLGKSNYPPVEKTWVKKGWNSAQVRNELAMCYSQRKLPNELLTTQAYDEDDLCMLRKGFSPLPNPDRSQWFDPCDLLPERIKCRVYRGEIFIDADKSAATEPSTVQYQNRSSGAPTPITIAPSTDQATKLQDQVQKDSNTHMNKMR